MTACFRPCTWGRGAREVTAEPLLPLELRPHPHARLCSAVSIVMGVPSVRREVHSYLTDTLSSLMSELSAAEKEDCVIVVLIAEVSGLPLLPRAPPSHLIPLAFSCCPANRGRLPQSGCSFSTSPG